MTTSPSNIKSAKLLLHTNSLNESKSNIAGKCIYVFLDYDGTLTPIVPDPSQAHISDEMRRTLKSLVESCIVGVITGRGRSTITSFLGEDVCRKISIAASHGFDISLPTGDGLRVGDTDHMSEFNRFKAFLSTCQFPPGCVIEDTEYTVSVHYRHVAPYLQSTIGSDLREHMRPFSGLQLTEGKMVYEIRLNLNWNKGKAVRWILDKVNKYNLEDICVFYIGDDLTDEDAFEEIKEYPRNYPIIVADKLTRPTSATLRLQDSVDVLEFLTLLIHTITMTEA